MLLPAAAKPKYLDHNSITKKIRKLHLKFINFIWKLIKRLWFKTILIFTKLIKKRFWIENFGLSSGVWNKNAKYLKFNWLIKLRANKNIIKIRGNIL